MSNPKPDPQQNSLDALAALQGNTPAPPPTPDAPAEPVDAPSGDGSLSASGFVGMLAKPQPIETEPLDAAPASLTALTMAHPQPQAPGAAPVAHGINTGNTATIGQAREIQFHDPSSQVAPAPKYRKRHVPSWYKIAVPIMFTFASLLTLVGLWAIGACVALAGTFQGYPLMDLVEDDNGNMVFLPWCKWMAVTMPICLPVAVAMVVMGSIMHKQAKIAEAQTTTPI